MDTDYIRHLLKIRVHPVHPWINSPVNMDSKKLAQLCREFADNKKAENIVILDVRKLSSVTDYFVIASGTSEPHLRAIVEEITASSARNMAAPARGGRHGARRLGGAGLFRRDCPRHARGRARALRSGKSLGRRETGEDEEEGGGKEILKQPDDRRHRPSQKCSSSLHWV